MHGEVVSPTWLQGQKSPPKGYFSVDMNVLNPETWTPELVLQRRAVWKGAQCSTLSTARARDQEGQPGWLWSFQQTQADDGVQCPGVGEGSTKSNLGAALRTPRNVQRWQGS